VLLASDADDDVAATAATTEPACEPLPYLWRRTGAEHRRRAVHRRPRRLRRAHLRVGHRRAARHLAARGAHRRRRGQLGEATSSDGTPGELAVQDPRCFHDDGGAFVAEVTAIGSDRSAESYILTRRGSF
jgi:hypothetical protein